MNIFKFRVLNLRFPIFLLIFSHFERIFIKIKKSKLHDNLINFKIYFIHTKIVI